MTDQENGTSQSRVLISRSSPGKKNRHDTLLIEHVLKWKFNEIKNDKLLSDKVKSIPMEFVSLQNYFDSFKWPLLEEVRAQTKQSLEQINGALFYKVVEVHGSQGSKYPNCTRFAISLDQEEYITSVMNGEGHKFIPRDLVLLSPGNIVPDKGPQPFILAMVNDLVLEEQENRPEHCSDLGVLVLSTVADVVREELIHGNQSWYMVYLSGLATPWRIWQALHPEMEDFPDKYLLDRLLTYKIEEDSIETPSVLKNPVVEYCSKSLNESQTNAVTSVACKLECSSAVGLTIVQGPPGTGKTSTIVKLISVLSSLRMKCLVSAPTNIAVAGVATQFLNMIKASEKTQFSEFLLSSNYSYAFSKSKKCKIIRKTDMVLVGNKDRLPLQGSCLEEIYLPKRVKKIIVSNRTCREATFEFLELIGKGETIYQDMQINENSHKMSFLDFFSRKITEIVRKLEHHGNTLVEELNSYETTMYSQCVSTANQLMQSMLKSEISEKTFSEWASNDKLAMHIRNELQEIHLSRESANLSNPEHVEALLMEHASLVFCTVSSSGRLCVKRAAPFDCVIIDEAVQLVEAETTILTSSNYSKYVVLVGDHQQLPATVISKDSQEAGYGRSLFERMVNLGHPSLLLDTQYRMHPSISLFPNLQFYEGRLQNGENTESPSYRLHDDLLFGTCAFIDVKDGKEENDESRSGKSWCNFAEASVVITMIKLLVEETSKTNTGKMTVGVITPYSSQKELLTGLLTSIRKENLTVDINSVDGFQGQEKDIIIFSAVRANKHGGIGFLKDYRRLNVAITRAKYCLWIVGNWSTLNTHHSVWKILLEDFKCRGLYSNATDNPKIRKAVIKARTELGEYLDLFHNGSALFHNATWKVLFSHDFKKSFLKMKSKEKRQNMVIKIQRIAEGYHSSYNQVKFFVTNENVEGLIQVHRVGDVCLVWTIDVERTELVIQIIKVWDIVRFEEVPKYIRRLEAAFQTYSPDYIKKCKIKNSVKRLSIPASWEVDPDFIWLKSQHQHQDSSSFTDPSSGGTFNHERSTVNDSLLLMKFYALSSGVVEQLLTAQDGSEINLPFEVNDEESVIIRHPLSCFILGRSGSGKTTVLVSKLIRREQHHLIAVEGLQSNDKSISINDGKHEYLKQILVTLSPILCSAIRHHIAQIKRCLSGSEIRSKTSNPELLLDSDDEDKMLGNLPESMINVPSRCYPMVITFRKFLKMLDKSIPYSFYDLKGRKTMKESGHVENNLDISSAVDVDAIANASEESSFNGREVDFNLFDSEFWPHFNSSMTKKFDSSTVYTEIMSVIKGSLEAIKSSKGILSKEAYLSPATSRRHSNLDTAKREAVYDIYLQYEKLKMKTYSYDMADHVRHIYKHLSSGNYKGDKIDFIYIDEIQDFSQAQLSLFSFVGIKEHEGLVCAGDTAQVITQGVNFRFQDFQSLFYTEFRRSIQQEASMSNLTIDTTMDSCDMKKIFTPKLFQLTNNFRTHLGVVNMANSIIKLLYHYFPDSIDKLDLETSLVSGELPTLLKPHGVDVIKNLFESNDTDREGCDFGAQQVILVRDENRRNTIVSHIGKKSLVLTISGCKGLEFQDVLVYNFFTDSPLKNKWRVIYEYVHKIEINEKGRCRKESYPSFDQYKHHLLCSELKHLYVAVTRARQRLWFYEESDEYIKPIFDHWMHSGVVELKDADESFISAMRMSSTPDEWKHKGIELMNLNQFDMAITCFERAGDEHFAKVARAYNYHQIADKCFHKNEQVAKLNFQEAAKIFLLLGKADMAARCHIRVGDLQAAGSIYLDKCKPPRFKDAGNCFAKAQKWVDAATAFFKGGHIKECLDVCIVGKCQECGLLFIRQWEQDPLNHHPGETMSSSDFEELKKGYLWDCADTYHQKNKIATMLNFVGAFPTLEHKREFLRSRGHIHELMLIEEAEANYLQASELAELKGDFFHAAELLQNAGDDISALKKILFLVRKEVMWRLGNKEWPSRTAKISEEISHKVYELLQLTKGYNKNEAKLEIELCFADFKCLDFQQFKENIVSLGYRIEYNFMIRFLTNWDALHTCVNTLRKMKRSKQQPILPFQNFEVKVTLLADILHCWMEWQNDVLKFKNHSSEKTVREFIMDFFAVSHYDQSTNTYIVHDPDAYWMRAGGIKKKLSNNRIPVQDFQKLAGRYWDEIISNTDNKLMELVLDWFHSQLGGFHSQLGGFQTLHQKAELLLRLIDLTKMPCLSDKVETTVHALESELFLLLWPRFRNPQVVCHIQQKHGDSRIQSVLDSIANKLGAANPRNATAEACGRLELLYPFLSTTAKDKLFTGAGFPDPWCYTDLKSNCELKVEDFILQFGNPLIKVFNMDWKKVRSGYITPFVFVALLEKTVVMTMAYITNLHGMIIPLTLALDFMCGKEGGFYQKLQRSDRLDERIICLLQEILDVLDNLLMMKDALCDWFRHVRESNIPNVLPAIVQRLLVILFVIYLNGNCLSFNLSDKLYSIFNQKHSALQCLSTDFTQKCKNVLHLQHRAMEVNNIDHVLSSMGDTLVMIKRCGNGCCIGTGFTISKVELEVSCDFFMKFSGLVDGGGGLVGQSSPSLDVQVHTDTSNIIPQVEEKLKTKVVEIFKQRAVSTHPQNEKKDVEVQGHTDCTNIMPLAEEKLKRTKVEESKQQADLTYPQNEKKGSTKNDARNSKSGSKISNPKNKKKNRKKKGGK